MHTAGQPECETGLSEPKGGACRPRRPAAGREAFCGGCHHSFFSSPALPPPRPRHEAEARLDAVCICTQGCRTPLEAAPPSTAYDIIPPCLAAAGVPLPICTPSGCASAAWRSCKWTLRTTPGVDVRTSGNLHACAPEVLRPRRACVLLHSLLCSEGCDAKTRPTESPRALQVKPYTASPKLAKT